MKPFIISIALLSWFSISPLLAQVCNPNISPTTPNKRYQDNGDGSVTDKKTKLQWSRCSIGQTWHKGSCLGDAQPLLWSVASLVAATTEAKTNQMPWRMPEIKELSELVELQCARPATNLTIFPATPAGAYWTNTRFANKDGSFWQVRFILGETIPEMGDRTAYVRLVRDPK